MPARTLAAHSSNGFDSDDDDYETLRQAKIQANLAVLLELGLTSPEKQAAANEVAISKKRSNTGSQEGSAKKRTPRAKLQESPLPPRQGLRSRSSGSSSQTASPSKLPSLVPISSFINDDDENLDDGGQTFTDEVLPLLISAGPSRPSIQRAPHLKVRIHNPKSYGSIPNIPIGTWFPSRMASSLASIHAPTVAGISGDAKTGCFSVCVSGIYDENDDQGDSLIYTGSGGRDLRGSLAKPKNLRTAPQSSDQSFDHPLNHSLVTSCKTGKPIRVLRGFRGYIAAAGSGKKQCYSPPAGYVYCGLMKVKRYWLETGKTKEGWKVCRYELERCPGQAPLPRWRIGEVVAGEQEEEVEAGAFEADSSEEQEVEGLIEEVVKKEQGEQPKPQAQDDVRRSGRSRRASTWKQALEG